MRGTIKAVAPLLVVGLLLVPAAGIRGQEPRTAPDSLEGPEGRPPPDEFLELGTEASRTAEDFMRFDRGQIRNQILQFIPPLLQPAFVGHAFVLPPGTFRATVASRFAGVDGNDFSRNGEADEGVFGEHSVGRTFVDLDFFYGFDLNRSGLHAFTLRVNVPYREARADGFIHPNGVGLLDVMNTGSSREIGDVGLFLKKRVADQGNFPVGLAVAGAVFLPTGSNEARFGDDGRILARRPDPDGEGVQPSFDAIIREMGGPDAFFDGGFRAPVDVLARADRILTPFPFNDGVFGRFSADGRMAASLQPGTGDVGFLVGGFLTRQFEPGDFGALGRFPGRSAMHLGVTHRFNRESEGIDPGDLTTFFASFVKPVFKDYLAFDLSFVGFHEAPDHYDGVMPEPRIVTDADTGTRFLEFALVDRPTFSRGTSAFLSPNLILSPDPLLRFTASGLFRVRRPELGPAPDAVLRLGASLTF